MANFGINLDLRLNGQTAVDRAVRGAKALEDVVRRINNKPLNLANIGGAARFERLSDARKKVIELAKAINKGTKDVGKTEVAVRETLSAFSELAANTAKNTTTFKEFTAVVAKAEKELNDIARASENARRAQKGMMSLEEREAQLERRSNTLRTLRTKKKLKDEEARARKRNADAIDRENKRLARQAEINKRNEKRQRERAVTNFGAGIGFPLLMGGGPGTVIGGALGAFGGFGGSIIGSALGQQLDKLGSAALSTGETFNKLTRNVEQLIPKLGTGLQPGFQGTAQFLVGQGRGSEVATVARDAFEQTYGRGAAQRFEELGRTNREFKQVMEELGVELQDFMSGPLKGLLEAIKRVTGVGVGTPLETSRERFMQERSDLIPQIAVLEGKEQLSFNEKQQLFDLKTKEAQLLSIITKYTREINGEDTERLTLQKILNDVLKQQADIQEKETELVKIQLTARRDSLAEAQGQLAVDKAANELSNTQKQLKEEENRTEKDTLLILQLQNREKEQQGALDRARLQLTNSVLQAERQIQREQISGAISNIGMIQKEKGMQLQFNQMQQGRFELVEQEARAIEDRFHVNTMVLELENKRALIGVTEAERIASINREYDIRRRIAKEQYYLDLQALEQAEAAYNLSKLRVEQEIKLQNLTAAISAQQQIKETSPFERTTELLDPFFGASRQLEIDQAVAYNDQLTVMEQRLKDVAEQLNIFALNPDVRKGLEDQERQIKNQIANFKEYQPAIDEAALAQARFTEALAITVPVTDAVFNNLLAVVEGTKTAEQAFADFLRSIASMLMQAAQQMIATYIAIGVARMFAGMPKMSGGQTVDITTVNPGTVNSLGGLGADGLPGIGFRANGGSVSAGSPYIVGERGPELFVPGAQGNIVPTKAMGGANIVVNVDASGSQAQGSEPNAKALGAAIGAAVQAELVKQKRPGGLLS